MNNIILKNNFKAWHIKSDSQEAAVIFIVVFYLRLFRGLNYFLHRAEKWSQGDFPASGVTDLCHQLMTAPCQVTSNFTSCLLNTAIFQISYGGKMYTRKIIKCHNLEIPSVHPIYQHIIVRECQSYHKYKALGAGGGGAG